MNHSFLSSYATYLRTLILYLLRTITTNRTKIKLSMNNGFVKFIPFVNCSAMLSDSKWGPSDYHAHP